MKIDHYPFSAIVGQETMKTALLLNVVDPTIGGVLIRGQKGTAKSTAARALAALLPPLEVVEGCPYHCPPDRPEEMHDACRERFENQEKLTQIAIPTPMIDLPLGATEDRVVGSLALEETLRHGKRHFEPGLLAAANRGILYVDEVNLLEDHLVDLLLDAAASGINRVEREGFCLVHPSRFMLIGTMNPEEGELRPQFLDRFGLTVTVEGVTSPQLRGDLVRRRLDFERDPAGFVRRWSDQENFLKRRIAAARALLDQISVTDTAVDLAVKLSLKLNVQGHRADLALLKAGRALAALLDRKQVGSAEVSEVAWLVLPHRLPGGTMLGEADVRKILGPLLGEADNGQNLPDDGSSDLGDPCDTFEFPGAAAAGSMLFETFKKKLQSA